MKLSESESSDELLVQTAHKMLKALRKISKLRCYLLYDGPAREDLHSLSDALEQAINIADEVILQIEIDNLKS